MSELASHADEACPAHEELGFALARDLGEPAGASDRMRVRTLAATLPALDDPIAELEAVAGLLGGALRPDHDGPLLLPGALRGGGAPAGAVVAAVAVARRAGYDVDVVGNGTSMWIAHRELETMVVDPLHGVRDGRELGVDLAWMCAHESAACVLDHVVGRAERDGDIATSLAGAALRLALPLDEESRRRNEREHRRLLSRLN